MVNNSNKKISFVIPAFNCADTIEESVDSIVRGNLKKGDEIIIVNDGSTDKTAGIIKKLENKYPFIITITNKENKGCPATRNIGINRASNTLIFNLDSDDVLHLGSISKLKEHLIENNADIATFSENRFFIKNTKKITHKWVTKGGILTLANFLAGPITPGGNFLYTKESWEKIGGYWEYGKGLHEYWGFTLKQLANGAKLTVMPKSYYFHRYGTGDSLFIRESKKENENYLITNKMIENFFNLIEETDVKYIKNNKETWFSNLNKHPIKLKGQAYGKTGKVVYKFTYKRNVRPLIIRTIKYFHLHDLIKNIVQKD